MFSYLLHNSVIPDALYAKTNKFHTRLQKAGDTHTHITQEQQNLMFTVLAGGETVQFGLNAAQSLDEVCRVRFAVQYSKTIGCHVRRLRNGGSPAMVST